MFKLFALLLVSAFLVVGCGAGQGGGDDNTKRGGADSVTGPGVSVVVNCATTTSSDRNVGDTTTNVTVDCPNESGNVTNPTAKTPSAPPAN